MCHLPKYFGHIVVASILCAALAGCATSPYGTPLAQGGPSPSAQTCASAASPPPDLAKQPNYRQVVVAAQTQNNLPPPKLLAKDLRLYQGDKQLEIAFFEPRATSVGILVDTSGSMELKLPICRAALEAFINDLYPSDELSLFAFSDRVHVLARPTTDHAGVIKDLAILHAYGRTALYDSLVEGLHAVSQGCAKTKTILLITDGMDDASSSSITQVVDLARENNVAIYSVGIGNPNINVVSGYPYFTSLTSAPELSAR